MKSMLLSATIVSLVGGQQASGQSNIHPDHKYGWCENIGWTNWRDADQTLAGVSVGPTFLSGFIWAENVGWINVGDGEPADGHHYDNFSGSDSGVNFDWTNGLLSGLGWGENIGWVNFGGGGLADPPAPARIRCNGAFRGFVWGENVGWINLAATEHYLAVAIDCNNNEQLDFCDIRDGSSEDCNHNLVPDECDCPGDTNGDGTVDFEDILMVLAEWGATCEPDEACPGDNNCDSVVDFADILAVLSNWGPCT